MYPKYLKVYFEYLNILIKYLNNIVLKKIDHNWCIQKHNFESIKKKVVIIISLIHIFFGKINFLKQKMAIVHRMHVSWTKSGLTCTYGKELFILFLFI